MANEVKGPILGTVLLAGVNSAGQPARIDQSALVAGMGSDGVPRWLLVDSSGNVLSSGDGVDLSSDTPASIGPAAAGVGTEASRDDHVHAIMYAWAKLAADVDMATANTFYDGPSVSLSAGTWLIFASVLTTGSSATAVTSTTIKIWDGTTVLVSSEQIIDNTARQVSCACMGIVTLGSTTTYKVSATNTGNSADMKAAALNNGAGNNATQIVAIKIA